MSAIPDLTTFKFDDTLGALLVGFAVSSLVYGIVASQIVTYYTRYPTDKIIYKALVFGLWFLETLDQIFIGHFVYFYTISNYAKPLEFLAGRVTWSLILQLTFGALVGVIVKICFVLRVWRFSKHNKHITAFLLAAVFGQLGMAIAYTIKAFTLHTIYQVSKLRTLGTISLAVGVFTDVAIAASLCYFLRSFRTGHNGADNLVNILSRYAINTGALTSAVSLTTLILYNALPNNNFIFVAVYFCLSKLYSVSFMATLNTRKIFRGRGTDYSHAQSSVALTGGTVRIVMDSSQTTAINDVELDSFSKHMYASQPTTNTHPTSPLRLHGQSIQTTKMPESWQV